MPESTNTTTQGAYDATKGPDQLEKDASGRRIDIQNTALEEENRAKLLESGQIPEGTPEQLAKEQTFIATYGVANPQFQSPAITSDLAAREVDTMYRDVQAGLNETTSVLQQPKYQQYQDFTGEIEAQRGSTKTAYEDKASLIEKDFAIRREEMEESNRLETGSQMASLAKMKAFGVSASAMSLMKSVQVQNEREYTKLLVEKHKLLLSAQEAYLSQDWDMLNEKITQSQKLTDQINQIEKQSFEDSLRTNEEIREQTKFGWEREDRAMGKMSTIIDSGIPYDELDQAEIATLEATADLPTGYFKQLYQANELAKEMQSVEDELALQKQIIELQEKLPQGMKFQVGDTLYEGWNIVKKDWWDSNFIDGNGNVTYAWYDKTTGDYGTAPLGNIGSPKNGWQTRTVDGVTYRVNPATGVAETIVTKGGAMNPANLEGFEDWVSSIGEVTVPYGGQTGFENTHPGWDIANNIGTSIPAFIGGEVVEVDATGAGGYGRYVIVQDADGRMHRYSHLHTVGVGVGDTVSSNQVIGTMGNSGNVLTTQGTGTSHVPNAEERARGYGAHLDYRVYLPGKPLATKEAQDRLDAEATSSKQLSRSEFLELYVDEVGTTQGMSPNVDDPKVKQEIDTLYNEYLKAFGEESKTTKKTTQTIPTLTTTDKQKMFTLGLDPTNYDDVQSFLGDKFTNDGTEEENSTTITNPYE